jgi:methionine aminotransferase
MSRLAAEEQALNLSQGFPDFDGPKGLLDRVQYYLTHGHNQYPPMMGVQSLREAIATKVKNLYGCTADPETEITVTSGATEALFCAIAAVVRPGDEVIVFDPAYDSYEPAVTLQGGVTRHVPLSGDDFHVDWNRVEDAINEATRLIIVNTPHNPTGSVWSEQDMRTLARLADNRGLYVLADEVYEHIIFDGVPHQSMCLYPELYARSFVVSSFGKTYHTTGWKVGYCVAPPGLTEEFRKIHQFVTFTTNTPMQLGLADFLQSTPEHHLQLGAFYQHKRDLFCSLLEDSCFSLRPSQGTYFQLLDYSAYSNEVDVDLAVRLTQEIKIASIPVSVFYDPSDSEAIAKAPRVLRFCFAKEDDTLKQAGEILCQLGR